jgi:hypothetical protein
MTRPYRTLEQLLAAFLAKTEFTESCWLWTGGKTGLGYGQLGVNGRAFLAHRWIYEVCNGPIPAGLELDHLCRNPGCVNPDHLEPVTHRINLLRGVTLAAQGAQVTHCPQGHEYAGENLLIKTTKKGKHHRACRQCSNLYMREYMRQQRSINVCS